MCGLVGLIGTPDAAREAFLGLTILQHRGQDAAGILSYDADGFHKVKGVGLVESVFTRDNMASLTGNVAVGHARYSTVGRTGDLSDVQPFVLSHPFGIGLVHNGNLLNHREIGGRLRRESRRTALTHSDSEVILNLFADGLARSPAAQGKGDLDFDMICAAVGDIFREVNGSYSIITLVADAGLVAFRDPNGFRPLVWGSRREPRVPHVSGAPVGPGPEASAGAEAGKGSTAYMIASESAALSFLGYGSIQDVAPGEVVFIDMAGKVHRRVLDRRPPRHCMIEWVYFASPESVIDDVPVYGARIQLGRHLAKQLKTQIAARKIEADLVVPVPETSRIAAIALSEELGIPYREVLIKNRYIKRTFILESQEKRQTAVNLKFSPVRSEIEGKRVLLVDDSIVRGTTSKKIIELVREAGASKIYFVSTCPPIQHPCFYGIDFPDESELIASHRTEEEIGRELGVDAVIYQTLDGLREAIAEAAPAGKRPDDPAQRTPCMACLDGRYPTDVSIGGRLAAVRKNDRET